MPTVPALLLLPTCHKGGDLRALAGVGSANAPRSVELMGGECQHVRPQRLHVQGQMACSLHGVHME